MNIGKAAGLTLIELIVVVAIIGVMLGLAVSSFQTYHDQYGVEAQVRRMHIDMVHARGRAFLQNKACFVTVAPDGYGYQIIEDTNDSGGSAPDAGDSPLWPEPKRLTYRAHWTGTVILSRKGTISKSPGGGIFSNNPVEILFDTAGAGPQYDCISVGPTRMNVGKWNGAKCSPI